MLQEKQSYSPPSLTELSPDQARKLVMERKHCSDKDADEFLTSLRQQPRQTLSDQERKRPA